MASHERFKESWQRQLAVALNELGARAVVVGVAISWHRNRETGDAFPSMTTLATLTGSSPATVKRAINKLVAGGHMTRVRKRKNGPNHYTPVLNEHGVKAMTPRQVKAVTHRQVIAMTPEPPNQPHIEPGKGDLLDEEGRKIPVEVGTDQWNAWVRYRQAKGARGCPQTDVRIDGKLTRGWYFAAEWPPQ